METPIIVTCLCIFCKFSLLRIPDRSARQKYHDDLKHALLMQFATKQVKYDSDISVLEYDNTGHTGQTLKQEES